MSGTAKIYAPNGSVLKTTTGVDTAKFLLLARLASEAQHKIATAGGNIQTNADGRQYGGTTLVRVLSELDEILATPMRGDVSLSERNRITPGDLTQGGELARRDLKQAFPAGDYLAQAVAVGMLIDVAGTPPASPPFAYTECIGDGMTTRARWLL